MSKSLISIETEIVVPFHDLDPMEVAWHGHYVKYFEIARCVLLDRIDYNYPQMRASGYAWPVIDLHVRYTQPARFNQRLKVAAELVEWEHRMKITYTVRDAQTGRRLTKGHTIQVAVSESTGEMCFVSPDILPKKLGCKPT